MNYEELIEAFLATAKESFTVESLGTYKNTFLSFNMIPLKKYLLFNKNRNVYVLIAENPLAEYSTEEMLEVLEDFTELSKTPVSLLVVANTTDADLEKCMYSNANALLHIVFYDHSEKTLLFNKDFSYTGSKEVKQLIDLFINLVEQDLKK